MELEAVNQLIGKFEKYINFTSIRNGRKAIIILFVISACFLLSMKSFIATAVLFVLTVCEFVYISVIIKKKATLYNGIVANIILMLNIVLTFNIALYYIQWYLGCSNAIITIIVCLFQILCFFLGFFYTHKRVKNGTVNEIKTAVSPVVSILPCVLGMVSVRMISKTDISTQFTIYTLMFTFVNLMLMFCVGMIYTSMAYFIKKHNIPDRELNGDTNSFVQ